MKVILIFITSFLLLTVSKQEAFSIKKSQTLNTPPLTQLHKSIRTFYIATQTGIKKGVSRQTKKALKELGLLHLMTPSGIHLSSLLLFIFIFIKGKYRVFIYLACGLLIFPLIGFYSLKRIIIFHLLKFILKKNESSFLMTFALDLMFGGYLKSPLSFTYSFLCWGVIIFSRNKWELILNLFLAQVYISFFNQEALNMLSIIVNPILTSIFSLLFPVMSINFWLLEFSWLSHKIGLFLNYFLGTIEFIAQNFSFFLFIPSSFFLIMPVFNIKFSKKIFLGIIILSSPELNYLKPKKINPRNVQLSLAPKREILKKTYNRINYFDRVCKRVFRGSYWEIKCKKKALHQGGPFI